MRALRSAELLRHGELVLRAEFDLQSGPRGWRALAVVPVAEHPRPGRYRLRFEDGDERTVRLDAVEHSSRPELRLVGVAEPPDVIFDREHWRPRR